MFGDLDWPLNASRGLSAIAEFLVGICNECNEYYRCASVCVVRCQICNREVAGSNLGLGYFAPRSTQPSIHQGSVNEYQLRLGRQRQVWLIPIADERVGMRVKLRNPSRTPAIYLSVLRWWFTIRRGAISSVWTFTFIDDYSHHR